LLAFAGAGTMMRAQQPAPDLVLSTEDHHGRRSASIAQAVAIRGDRIVAVTPTREIWLAGPNTRRIDLGGKAVTPGLIDNHMHLLRAGTPGRASSTSTASSRGKRRSRWCPGEDGGPGGWVFNIRGWTHHQFADDGKPFTRDELDRIAPDNPVALRVVQVFLNSRGLEAFGIKENAPDPNDFVRARSCTCGRKADRRDPGRHCRHVQWPPDCRKSRRISSRPTAWRWSRHE
jgi:predicted amidohydrolase YtcJ